MRRWCVWDDDQALKCPELLLISSYFYHFLQYKLLIIVVFCMFFGGCPLIPYDCQPMIQYDPVISSAFLNLFESLDSIEVVGLWKCAVYALILMPLPAHMRKQSNHAKTRALACNPCWENMRCLWSDGGGRIWEPCGTLKWEPPTPRKAYPKQDISTINSEPPAPKKATDLTWCKIQTQKVRVGTTILYQKSG